jgi:dTDP-4-dehydrorhamnose reductase
MNILLTGANGMLAHACAMELPLVAELDRSALDITDPARVVAALDRFRPDVVINCAAYTNVTAAEQDYATALKVNAKGPAILADACAERGIKLVHFGTDFIFPGRPGGDYREDEPTQPVNRYSASKLEGELLIRQRMDDYLILRVSWLYGPFGKNFVSTIGSLLKTREEVRIVSDQYNRVTYTFDIVSAVRKLLDRNASGVFHFANQGVISRYDFTVEIARLMNDQEPVHCRVIPIPGSEYPDPTPRPENSAMNCDRYEAFVGEAIPDWKDSLARYLRDFKV